MENYNILFIRHADYFKPTPGAYYGQTDLPLTSDGEARARELKGLIDRMGLKIERVYSSDLARARRTAELALPGKRMEQLTGLRETSFGEWEGMRYADVHNLPEFGAFAAGGAAPGGESSQEVESRVAAALDGILRVKPEGDIAIVAHAGPIRLMLALLIGLNGAENWRFRVDMASVSTVTLTDGYAYLSALNIRPGLFN